MEELTINLIEEDDRRLTILGLFEKQPQLTFSFSNPFRQAIRSFPHEERCDNRPESSQISDSLATRGELTDLPPIRTATRRKSSRQQRLTSSRRSMEQYTSRRSDCETFKDFWVEEGKRNHLLELLNVRTQSSNRIERDRRWYTEWISISESYRSSRV